jgi:hypothetical protein
MNQVSVLPVAKRCFVCGRLCHQTERCKYPNASPTKDGMANLCVSDVIQRGCYECWLDEDHKELERRMIKKIT